MQKLVKRTAEAQRAAARKIKKASYNEYIDQKHRRRQEQTSLVKEIAQDLRDARVARRQRWELGPAAPRRDLDGKLSHAAVENRHNLQSPLRQWQVEQRCSWAGGAKFLNIAVNDRVVILDGPDKGKIDTIASINMESATVQLATVGKHLVKVPELYQKIGMNDPTTTMSSSIPISSIRLVHPLTDPETGKTRDVIVRSLTRGPVIWHNPTGWRAWTRYITGMNVAIPWPERELNERKDHPADTVRVDVAEPTFVPTLLTCPMPEKLIDELRNRYSKFRTRHEPEYVARKEMEAAEKASKNKEGLSMLTPVQEFNQQQRQMRRARGQPMLTQEMLERIGQVIAKNKTVTLEAAGVTEVRGGGVAGRAALGEQASVKESPSPTP